MFESTIVTAIWTQFSWDFSRYDTGSISGVLAMDYFQNEFSTGVNSHGVPALTSSQTSLVVSILSAGTFFGMILQPSSLPRDTRSDN